MKYYMNTRKIYVQCTNIYCSILMMNLILFPAEDYIPLLSTGMRISDFDSSPEPKG